MPFEQKYSPETREAATKRAVELKTADPKDRTVIRVVSEEFGVGTQSLRGWLADALPDDLKPVKRERRPKFSPVVTTQADPGETPEAAAPVEVAELELVPATTPAAGPRVALLEEEVRKLRRDNGALKDAMRVLLEA